MSNASFQTKVTKSKSFTKIEMCKKRIHYRFTEIGITATVLKISHLKHKTRTLNTHYLTLTLMLIKIQRLRNPVANYIGTRTGCVGKGRSR